MYLIPSDVSDKLSYCQESGVFTWIDVSKYHSQLNGEIAGCEVDGYIVIKIDGIPFKAHRLAWYFVTGEQPVMIDHKNGNGLDNRFLNLRDCDHSGNAKNHGKTINGSGLPCGVRLIKSGKYQARITCDGNLMSLGAFDTAEQAESVYKEKRAELFKEFNRK